MEPTAHHLLCCRTSAWYPAFARHAFPTVIVPVGRDFVEWLLSDGLFVGHDSTAFPARSRQAAHPDEDDYQDWGDGGGGESDGDAAAAAGGGAPPFPELRAALAAGIASLGGRAAPKLTWSAPLDAAWLAPGRTLACGTPDEVLLLLKASDRAAHDVEVSGAAVEAAAAAAANGVHGEGLDGADAAAAPPFTHELVLREWRALRPEREFRVFVVRGAVAGISARAPAPPPELGADGAPAADDDAAALRARLLAFHAAEVAGRFPLADYAADVYCPAAESARVRVVDFNPLGGATSPLLFEWAELLGEEEGGGDAGDGGAGEARLERPELRLAGAGGAPLRPAPYGAPYDLAAPDAGALGELLERMRAAEGEQ